MSVDLTDDNESSLYNVTWECCVCFNRLGRDPSLVPCINANCPEHNVCLKCARELPRANGVVLCPLCRTPASKYLPLPSFVDTAKDPAAAEEIRAFKRAKTATQLPAPPGQRLTFTGSWVPKPSVLPAVCLPESIRPWNDPTLRHARREDMRRMIESDISLMDKNSWTDRTFWCTSAPSYDAPYVLQDAGSTPLDMARQTTLHAICADTIASLRSLFPGFAIDAIDCFDPPHPGVFYMLHRIMRNGASQQPAASDAERAVAQQPNTPPELWNSPRLYALRKAHLIDLIDEFLLRRASVDMPLVAGQVYLVWSESSPDYECRAVAFRKGDALRKPLLAQIAADTARLVAPLYPDLRLAAAPVQKIPDSRVYRDAYMCVTIALAPSAQERAHSQ